MHIVKTTTFRAAAEAIACLQPDPITGTVTVSQIKVAIGEHLDVWPASIFDDIAGDESNLNAAEPERLVCPTPMSDDKAAVSTVFRTR